MSERPHDVVALDDSLLAIAVDLACDGLGSNAYAAVVDALARRPIAESFDALERLTMDPRRRVRVLAVEVLGTAITHAGQASDAAPAVERVVARLAAVVGTESEEEVLHALGEAFERVAQPAAALGALGPLVSSENPHVRFACAIGLGWICDERAIALVARLSADDDSVIRAHAIGSLVALRELDGRYADSLTIRSALVARLDDDWEPTRASAIWGLARRGDARAFDLVATALEGEVDGLLIGKKILRAARDLADPRLCDPLHSLRARWSAPAESARRAPWWVSIDDAIAACCRDCDPPPRP